MIPKKKFKDCLDLALDLAGKGGADAQQPVRNAAAAYLNRWVKRFWTFHWWPSINRVEARHCAPVWSIEKTYENGDFVWYWPTNAHYECLGTVTATPPVDSDNEINAQYWAEVATTHEAADYDSTQTYAQGDTVTLRADGRVYQSRVDSNTTDPDNNPDGPTNWGVRHDFSWTIPYTQSEPERELTNTAGYSDPLAVLLMDDEFPGQRQDEILVSGVANEKYNGLFSITRVTRSELVYYEPGVDPGGSASVTGATVKHFRRTLGDLRRIWDRDPFRNANACHLPGRRRNTGIQNPWVQGTVWVEFRDPIPAYTNTAYDSTETYAADDVILFTDGHNYRCTLATNAGESPETHPGKWEEQGIPPEIYDALATAVWGSIVQAQQGINEGRGILREAEDILKKEVRELSIDQSQNSGVSIPAVAA